MGSTTVPSRGRKVIAPIIEGDGARAVAYLRRLIELKSGEDCVFSQVIDCTHVTYFGSQCHVYNSNSPEMCTSHDEIHYEILLICRAHTATQLIKGKS